ncbi:MAG: glycoside hydrolase family 2 TIM barrel-domain containing protein, partial [Prolixibacteraceae bacterium]|nr:glycoside hydrolase family 2 TIM barrel-domain containing protein [Prolixibacteraceae bacterium]
MRLVQTINRDWTFNYLPFNEPDSMVMLPSYDDSRWQAVALPHTWSVYETTGEVHPFIYNASERDDPYWWYGWGYYRKRFFIDKSLTDKKVFIEFDGVQKYSRVYLNGNFVGDHKGGFTSFYFDVTDHISWDGENLLAVAVSNRRNDSHRIPPMTAGNWNVYGGIYRDVRLVVKNRVHIPFQGSYKHEGGTFVTTPRVTNESADVRVITWVKNEQERLQKVRLKTTLKDTKGNVIKVLTEEMDIDPGRLIQFDQLLKDIRKPLLWSPENPYLYRVKSEIFVQGKLVDEYESPLGFRYFNWDYENDDLYGNGEKMNIRGTNRHQEYPWLGDAHPKWIARMDMYDIKYNLGHNFMRLTHYPNDKYMYQLADSFGLVMVEEVPNIKSIDFDEDVQRQNVVEMIRRDRNHPSIFFWSMGNETTDAADSKWAFEEDTTRIIHLRKGEQGGDYVEHTHENLDMENLLRVTIRGWFDKDDAPEGINSTPENGQHSGNETWQHRMAMVREGSVRGLLGDNCVAWLYEDHGADREYKNCILKHINPKGWVDMYRQPKYIYWLTKVNYTDTPTVFIHPHFWRRRYSGQKRDIQVDSNCDKVELFVNDKSVGVKYPDRDSFNTLTFKDILIEEGTIKATGTKDGSEFFHEVIMPGDPAEIVLHSDQTEIVSGRNGIAIVTANIVDDAGNPVFDANNTLHWEVEGPGKLVGAPVFESDIKKCEEMGGTGYTVVPVSNVIRSADMPGRIKV